MNQQKIKRPRGGQTLSPDGIPTEAVQVRMSISDREAAKVQAQKLGVSLSAFGREAIKRHTRTIAKLELAD